MSSAAEQAPVPPEPTANRIGERGGPGPLALVGSGEYLPSMTQMERDLLADRPPRYVQLATAAAPEGEDSLRRWWALGARQAERLGVEQVVIDVRDRTDADSAELAAKVSGAGLIYLSGGNPRHLADTLRDTAVWAAVVASWRAGAALAGCSAGAMAMSGWVPNLRHPRAEPGTGLGLLPHLGVIPHFDKMGRWMPDSVATAVLRPVQGLTLLGIDEQTALVGGPHSWTVHGIAAVWEIGHGKRQPHPAGAVLVTP